MFTTGTISRNTAILYLTNILNVFASILLFSILARYLGTSDFGKFSFVFAFMSIAQSIANFGLDLLLVREVASDLKKATTTVGEILSLKVIISLFLALCVGLGIRFAHLPPVTERIVLIFLPYILLSNISLTLWALGDGFQRMEFRGFLTIIYYFTRTAICWVILKKGESITALFANLLVFETLFALANFLLAQKYFGRIKWKYNTIRAKHLLKVATPFAVSTILWIIFTRVDILLLNFMRGETAVGFYSPSQKILAAVLLLPQAFCNAIYPRMSELYGKDPAALQRLYQRSITFLLTASLCIVVFTVLTGPFLITLIFGSRYGIAGKILQIHIWMCPFYFVTSVILTIFSASNRQYLITVVYIISGLLGFSVMISLVRYAGYFGCAWAMVILSALLLIFSSLIFHGQRNKVFSLQQQ